MDTPFTISEDSSLKVLPICIFKLQKEQKVRALPQEMQNLECSYCLTFFDSVLKLQYHFFHRRADQNCFRFRTEMGVTKQDLQRDLKTQCQKLKIPYPGQKLNPDFNMDSLLERMAELPEVQLRWISEIRSERRIVPSQRLKHGRICPFCHKLLENRKMISHLSSEGNAGCLEVRKILGLT